MRVIEASWLDRLGRLCACAVLAVLPLAANAADEDPWEGFNRPVFSFNDTLDTYALKPVAKGYQAVTPQFFEDGVHNVFRNIGDVTNLANNLLQGKVHDAGVDGGLEVGGVGVGGGGDEHGVDAVDRLIDRRGGLRAVLARDRGGSVRGGVVDRHELHSGVLGEVTGMDGPDESGTEEGKTLHRWISFRRFV